MEHIRGRLGKTSQRTLQLLQVEVSLPQDHDLRRVEKMIDKEQGRGSSKKLVANRGASGDAQEFRDHAPDPKPGPTFDASGFVDLKWQSSMINKTCRNSPRCAASMLSSPGI